MKPLPELVNEGTELWKANRIQEAIQIAEEALARDSRYMDAYRLKLGCLYSTKQHDKLLDLCNQIYQFDPNFQYALHYEGLTLAAQGYLQRSNDVLDKCIALYPDWGNVYDAKGRNLVELGKNDEAIAVFYKQYEVSSNPLALSQISKILLEQKKKSEALKHLNKAIKAHPNYIKFFSDRAYILNSIDKLEEAILDMRLANDYILRGDLHENAPSNAVQYTSIVIKAIDDMQMARMRVEILLKKANHGHPRVKKVIERLEILQRWQTDIVTNYLEQIHRHTVVHMANNAHDVSRIMIDFGDLEVEIQRSNMGARELTESYCALF